MRIFISIAILFLFLNASSQPSSENVYKARAEFRNGMQKGVAKDFKGAIAHFSEAINLNPIYAEAFLYRGLAYNEIQKYEDAIKDFTICIELDPKFSDQAHFFRGVAKVGIENYNSAIQDYTTAIQLNPDFIAFFRRGQANMMLEEYARALQDFEIALRLNPSFIEGIYHRGKALYHLGQYPEAANDLRRASMDLRNNADAYYYSALARIETRDYYGAIRDLDKAIEINPDNPGAYRARALAHKHTGNNDLAKTDDDTANEIIENQPEEVVKPKPETTIATSESIQSERELPDFAALFRSREKQEDEKIQENEKAQSGNDVELTVVGTPVVPSIKTTEEQKLSTDITPESKTKVEQNEQVVSQQSLNNVNPGFYNKQLSQSAPKGFGVQIASYSNTDNLLSLAAAYETQFNAPVFIQISLINERRIYRLIAGELSSRTEAEILRDELRAGDFPDCFLFVYDRYN